MDVARHAQDIIVCFDLSFQILYGNKSACDELGYKHSQLVGKPYQTLIPERSHPILNEIRDKILFNRNIDHFETDMINAKGKHIYLSTQYSPILDNHGKITAISSISRKLNETQWMASHSAFIVEKAPDAIVVINEKGQIVLVNNQTEKLFGYSRVELLGKEIEFLIPYKYHKRHVGRRNKFLANPEVRPMGVGLDLLAINKSGKEFPVEISLSPIHTKKGVYVSSAIRDVTLRRKAEGEMLKLTKETELRNKELEEFVYIASHDLNEPLRTVMNFVDLLEKQYTEKLDEKGRKYIDFITGATARMRNLIKDLLDYARLGKNSELSEVDCNELLDSIQNDLIQSINECGATIQTGRLPKIKAYKTELRQLFQNLISNSLKFKKQNTEPKITISAKKQNDHWLFTVSDNGIGIPKDQWEKIFIVFRRLHSHSEIEGNGIGLAHCQKIVHLHQGNIWVDSEPGIGSTFYFSLSHNL